MKNVLSAIRKTAVCWCYASASAVLMTYLACWAGVSNWTALGVYWTVFAVLYAGLLSRTD